MNSYTITIAPNDNSGNATTLLVDTSGGHVRITDIHLHAENGLAGGQMPNVDFGLLLQAITLAPTRAGTPSARVPAATARPELSAEIHEQGGPSADSATPAAPEPAATPHRRGRNTAKAVEPAPVTRTRARRTSTATASQPAPTDTAAKPATRTRSKQATKTATVGARAYRRMPDDFATVYAQAGTAAAVADYYQVPRHTAQGWVRRIRETATAAPLPTRRRARQRG